jgi:beta-xylosidase
MASAPSVWGPFTPCPTNPVLGAASPTSLFQTVGHADLFAGPGAGVDAEWWAVCLASRVVGEGRPIGRESVLLRVDWAGEWPVVDLSAIDVPVSTLTEAPVRPGPWMDVLEEPRHRLLHLRVPPAGAVRFEGDALLLCPPRGVPVPLTAPFGAPAFCGVRQTDLHFECRVELALRGAAQGAGVEAGIVVYLDPERHLAIGTDGQGFVFTRVQPGAEPDAPRVTHERAPLPSAQPRLALRVRGTPERYVLEYAETGTLDDGEAWKALGEGKTSEVSGGFTGVILAVYAVQGQNELQKDSGLEVQVTRWLYRAMV